MRQFIYCVYINQGRGLVGNPRGHRDDLKSCTLVPLGVLLLPPKMRNTIIITIYCTINFRFLSNYSFFIIFYFLCLLTLRILRVFTVDDKFVHPHISFPKINIWTQFQQTTIAIIPICLWIAYKYLISDDVHLFYIFKNLYYIGNLYAY